MTYSKQGSLILCAVVFGITEIFNINSDRCAEWCMHCGDCNSCCSNERAGTSICTEHYCDMQWEVKGNLMGHFTVQCRQT